MQRVHWPVGIPTGAVFTLCDRRLSTVRTAALPGDVTCRVCAKELAKISAEIAGES